MQIPKNNTQSCHSVGGQLDMLSFVLQIQTNYQIIAKKGWPRNLYTVYMQTVHFFHIGDTWEPISCAGAEDPLAKFAYSDKCVHYIWNLQ